MHWYCGEDFKESFNAKTVPYSACVAEPLEFSLLIQQPFVLFGIAVLLTAANRSEKQE